MTLDELQPGSEILATLAEGQHPGVPYTLIAGNTTRIATDGENELKAQLRQTLHRLLSTPFFGEANDLWGSVKSARSLFSPSPHPQTPQPTAQKSPIHLQEIGYDHLSYFHDSAGLTALATAVCNLVTVHSP